MINAEYDVVIAGAGPTGLALAGELALKDLKVLVLERRAHRSEESRALGMHGRTLDLLAQRGLDGAFLARGHPVPQVRLRFEQRRQSLLDLSELDTDFGHLLILPQSETERILEEHAVSLGVQVRREAGVFALKQDRSGVTVRHGGKNPGSVRTSWVVGCDGSKSNVRDTIGAKFNGRPYPYTILVADVLLDRPPEDDLLIEVAKLGLVVCTAFGDGYYRLGIIDRSVPWSDDPVTMPEISRALINIFGRDLGPHDPIWTSRFVIQEKQATSYREGRVLLAGDAAHVHSPLGGQGLNLGVQDAFNLGWKLAAVQSGQSDASLLDSYAAERRRRSRAVITVTDLVTRLMMAGNPVPQRVRKTVVPLILSTARGRGIAAGALSGVTLRYPPTHRRVRSSDEGRRVPNLTLRGADGKARLFDLMHDGRFVLIDDGSVGALAAPWVDRLHTWHGTAVGAPRFRGPLLIRPDGYLGGSGREEVIAGLKRWCGNVPARGRTVT